MGGVASKSPTLHVYPGCVFLSDSSFGFWLISCLSTPLLLFAWRTFLFEYTPFIFYMEESKSFICDVIFCSVILWQPVLVFHTHDVHVRCKHECSSTCRLKDKCTDNAVCMWMVWCSIPVYIYRPRQHESTDSTSDQYTNSAWLGLVVLQIVRFHIQENTDTCMSKTVIGSSN